MLKLIEDKEILAQKSLNVAVNDETLKILDKMQKTIKYYENIKLPIAALAANQIGYLHRIVVLCSEGGFISMFNPEIVAAKGQMKIWEGCGSIAGVACLVKRPKLTLVKYTDENNEKQEVVLNEVGTYLVCHEIDHLDGILITDRAIKTDYFKSDGERNEAILLRNKKISDGLDRRQNKEGEKYGL